MERVWELLFDKDGHPTVRLGQFLPGLAGYILLYFLLGSLPWQGLKAADETQKEKLILKKKQTISTKNLCRGLPREFTACFDHIHSFHFGDTPKYSYLRRRFRDVFVRKHFEYDHVFDWKILEYLRTAQ